MSPASTSKLRSSTSISGSGVISNRNGIFTTWTPASSEIVTSPTGCPVSPLALQVTLTGAEPAELARELGDGLHAPGGITFLPYLSGERTPHNDAAIRGVFAGLAHQSGRAELTQAVLEGVAFGLLNSADLEYKAVITTTLALVALAGIAIYARQLRMHERLARLGLACILGGAIGNLIDRARQGYVLDFVDVYWKSWHFWAFNVADAAIFGGVAVLVLFARTPDRDKAPEPRNRT